MSELQAFTCDGCGDVLVPDDKLGGKSLYSEGWYRISGKNTPTVHACSAVCLREVARLLELGEL